MALLTVQQASLNGTPITYTAAAGGGDTFAPPGGTSTHLRVKNGSGAGMTVTITFPGTTSYGVNKPSKTTASIAAAGEVAIGPIPAEAVDTSTGLVSITYSSATSVTVAVVSV